MDQSPNIRLEIKCLELERELLIEKIKKHLIALEDIKDFMNYNTEQLNLFKRSQQTKVSIINYYSFKHYFFDIDGKPDETILDFQQESINITSNPFKSSGKVYNFSNRKVISDKISENIKQFQLLQNLYLKNIEQLKQQMKGLEIKINTFNMNDSPTELGMIIEQQPVKKGHPNKGIAKRIETLVTEKKLTESKKFTDEICDEVIEILKSEGFKPIKTSVYSMLNRLDVNNLNKKHR
jgi:hypothetical protein